MKQIQTLVLVLVAFSAMGCATHVFDRQQNWPGGSSHVVDQQFGNGSSVHIERTDSKLPIGGYGAYGYDPRVNPYWQQYESLGQQVMRQYQQAAVLVPIPQPQAPQPTSSAQASEAEGADDIGVIAEHQLRMQRELDEMKKNKK